MSPKMRWGRFPEASVAGPLSPLTSPARPWQAWERRNPPCGARSMTRLSFSPGNPCNAKKPSPSQSPSPSPHRPPPTARQPPARSRSLTTGSSHSYRVLNSLIYQPQSRRLPPARELILLPPSSLGSPLHDVGLPGIFTLLESSHRRQIAIDHAHDITLRSISSLSLSPVTRHRNRQLAHSAHESAQFADSRPPPHSCSPRNTTATWSRILSRRRSSRCPFISGTGRCPLRASTQFHSRSGLAGGGLVKSRERQVRQRVPITSPP